jgi:hypothetical protein
MRAMPCPFYPPSFDSSNNIWGEVRIMKRALHSYGSGSKRNIPVLTLKGLRIGTFVAWSKG